MRTALAFALVALTACPEDPSPIDRLDGNVVVGDARPIDASALDADLDASDLDGGGLDADEDERGLRDRDSQPSDVPTPCGSDPELELTAQDAIQRAGELSGRVVDVVGTATISTDLACEPGAPSCAAVCRASVDVIPGLRLMAGPCAELVGCEGSDCDLVCRPLTGITRRFRGQLIATPTVGLVLEAVLPP